MTLTRHCAVPAYFSTLPHTAAGQTFRSALSQRHGQNGVVVKTSENGLKGAFGGENGVSTAFFFIFSTLL